MELNRETPSSQSSYEFSAEQNDVIFKLAVKMKSVGMFFMMVGAISAVYAILNILSSKGIDFLFPIIIAFIFLISGNLTSSAARSFKMIVVTEGSDIEHLMQAVTAMYKIYKIQYSMIIGAAVLLILVIAIFWFTGSVLNKF
jgi:formate-dependent nitrite reductase membrane component NrfD